MYSNKTSPDLMGPHSTKFLRTNGFSKLVFVGWLPYCILFLLICAYEMWRIIVIFRNQCPQKVKIAGTPSLFGKWLTSIRYCYKAQAIHNKAYAQKLVEELGSAPIYQVSLRDALWERAFPEQTIDGLQVNNMDKNGSLSQKVFRHHAREHLPSLQTLMQKRLEEAIADEIDNKMKIQGWTYISANSTINRVVAKVNNVILVGDDLASNPQFFENVMKYLHFAAACEEILQFTPQALFPVVGWLIVKATRVTQNINRYLVPLAAKRIRDGVKGQEPKDTIQWIINSRKKASAEDVAQQTLSFIFGSAYQMPMLVTFSMYNLCRHPEYLKPLREEILKSGGVQFDHQNNGLPLLDSFLKETARLNPVTICMWPPFRESLSSGFQYVHDESVKLTVGMPRKIMTPFTFSNGLHIPANNWVVVPQQAQMKDPTNYLEPDTFNGFRFVTQVEGEEPASESRLSHPSWRFPFWGSVKQAWYSQSFRYSVLLQLVSQQKKSPARFYVTDMTKLIIKEFIMNYDFKLVDENVPDSFAWGVLRVPHPRLAFLLKKHSAETFV